jgi:hypothetical protein
MGLKTALGLTQLTSMLVFASIASWYVAPWLARQERATALTALVWPHVFRLRRAASLLRAARRISDLRCSPDAARVRRPRRRGARVRCDSGPPTQSSRRRGLDLVACGHNRFRYGLECFQRHPRKPVRGSNRCYVDGCEFLRSAVDGEHRPDRVAAVLQIRRTDCCFGLRRTTADERRICCVASR